jgi:hypothetical protein
MNKYVKIDLNSDMPHSGFVVYYGDTCSELNLVDDGCSEGDTEMESFEFITNKTTDDFYFIRLYTGGSCVNFSGSLKASWESLPDPIVYYPMDENTGHIVHNYGTSGPAGYVYNGYGVFGATWVPGAKGYALSFDGYNDYIEYSSISNTYFDKNKGTVVMWVQDVLNNPNYSQSVAFGISYGWGEDTLRLRVEENGVWVANSYRGTEISSAADLDDGKWHQVAVTWNTSQNYQRLYIDGEFKQSGSYNGNAYLPGSYYKICQFLGTYFWKGLMDELKIYNRVLHDIEIEQMVPPVPPNDECSGAERIYCGDPITGSLLEGSTASGMNYCNSTITDVWYYMEIPDRGTGINVYFIDKGGPSDEGFATIFTGEDCENLTEHICDDYRNTIQFYASYETEVDNEKVWINIGSEKRDPNQELTVLCFNKLEEK